MSGGSFGYAYSGVQDFAQELDFRLKNIGHVDADGCRPNAIAPETAAVLKEIQAKACEMAVLMRAVEWMYSSDIGEDTFMRAVLPYLSANEVLEIKP